MEEGTISKIFEYYFTKPKFKEEVMRALQEFFDEPDLKSGDKLKLKEEDEGMFNEWFIFDFKLKNGKTPLEDFYEENPYNLSVIRLRTYKDLQDNYFGVYKVKNVRLGEELMLENLQTRKVYKVREFSATFSLKEGQVFSARVGKVGDHYELVGSNPTFGPVTANDTLENILRKDKQKLNPKFFKKNTSKDGLSEKDGAIFDDRLSPTLKEAETRMEKVLKKYEIDKFVTTETIKEWIYQSLYDDENSFGANMLFSLVYPDIGKIEDVFKEILEAYNVFYNLCPQQQLGDKSPAEKVEEKEAEDIPSDIKMSLSRVPHSSEWGKNYQKVLKDMKNGEFKKALKNINKVFEYFLKHKISYPEIYRVYANKASCHFALGEVKTGERMLKIAHELNPLYGFAKQQLEKLKKVRFYDTRKKESNISQDVGYRYYKFLKSLNISFAHIPKK